MYTKNSKDERTVPWGQPQAMSPISLFTPWIIFYLSEMIEIGSVFFATSWSFKLWFYGNCRYCKRKVTENVPLFKLHTSRLRQHIIFQLKFAMVIFLMKIKVKFEKYPHPSTHLQVRILNGKTFQILFYNAILTT